MFSYTIHTASSRPISRRIAVDMPPKASTSTPTQPAKLTPQDVPVVFQRYRSDLQNLAQKIGELESEMEEHA